MAKIIIFGAGDIAQIAHYYFTIDSDHEVVAFSVDNAYLFCDTFDGKPLVPFEDISKKYPTNEYKMFIALSYSNLNKLREIKYFEAKNKGYEIVSYVSSKCTYMSQYQCGENCFIFENNTIQPFVKIGNNVTLWSGNHIGHHSILHDHLFISSHVVISGHCTISSNTFIGVNSTIGHQVKIASQNIIGAGSIITKSTEIGDVYVPARSIKLEKKSDQFNL
jgi:sugar O-acyltransferase (sialic acid O-acetyltransferase NeuD family)